MNTPNPTPLSRCGDCRFFDALNNGVCRKEPPKALPMPDGNGRLSSLALWPPVDANRDWCGAYQPDTTTRGAA